MTEGLAIEIAKDYMRSKKLRRKDYMLRYRHLLLDIGEKRVLKGQNHLFVILQSSFGVKVQSKAGVFELKDATIEEMQHVHRGLVWVINMGFEPVEVYFLQVIPKTKLK